MRDEFRPAVVEAPGVALATEIGGRAVQATPSQVQFKCKVMPRKKVFEIAELPLRFCQQREQLRLPLRS